MVISGAGRCVGPMMKFPSTFGEGTAPSVSSVAATNPRVWGSRAGGVGRADWELGLPACVPAACAVVVTGDPVRATSTARVVKMLIGDLPRDARYLSQ